MTASPSPASPCSAGSQEEGLRLLVVDADAAFTKRLCDAVCGELDRAEVVEVGAIAAARGALEAGAFDAVWAADEQSDGDVLELIGLVRRLRPYTPTVVCSGDAADERVVQLMRAGAADFFRKPPEDAPLAGIAPRLLGLLEYYAAEQAALAARRFEERSIVLSAAQGLASRLKHEISNPLAIISGNTQLLIEVCRMSNLGEDFLLPLADIEEACRRIDGELARLAALRDTLHARLLGR